MIKLLLNPFERFAGAISLALGTVIIVITAAIAFAGNIHLDGVIDLHISAPAPFNITLAEGAIDWLCMVVFIYIAGLVLSKSSIRFIDVLGTQAMARFPMLIACAFSALLYTDKIEKYFAFAALHQGYPVEVSATDWLAFGVATLLMLVCIVWMISLMYKAYSISCNIKGTKGVVSFIACIILAEVASKLLITLIIQ